MKPYTRKLFLYDDPPYSSSTTTNATSSRPSSSKALSQYNPPFDSSMALTVVILLTALFFMGFFCVCIRSISEDPAAHLSRRRRYRGDPLDSFLLPSDHYHGSVSGKGLDPTTVRSLPVYSYHGNAKYQIDCAICLSEFEERECVKTIPYCKHVFHVECIDSWLASHVSCPVCRGTKLFEIKDSCGGGLGVIDQCASQTSTLENSNTCIVMRTISRIRRASSCSSLQQRAMLQRTLSF